MSDEMKKSWESLQKEYGFLCQGIGHEETNARHASARKEEYERQLDLVVKKIKNLEANMTKETKAEVTPVEVNVPEVAAVANAG